MTATDPVQHTQFTVERMLATRPTHAFRFWSDPHLKARWTGCHPDWTVREDSFDFRVGGSERKRWRTPDGAEQTFTAHWLDIVPDRRLLYAYEMSFAGTRLSASLVTIVLATAGNRTRMTWTEQVAQLTADGDAGTRRRLGTGQGLDRLVAVIADAAPDA